MKKNQFHYIAGSVRTNTLTVYSVPILIWSEHHKTYVLNKPRYDNYYAKFCIPYPKTTREQFRRYLETELDFIGQKHEED